MTNSSILTWLTLVACLLLSSQSLADDSCQFALDGECDEPHACATGTDSTDCGVTTSAADSCQYAFDGVCDEPGLCQYGTDSTDCSAGSDIYQLARRIQFEVDLHDLTGSTDVFAEWHDSEYSLLICGNYFPSLVEGLSPVPQTALFQRCQSMGGCDCDIEQNSFQALAMKRNADASIETLTWFEDGPVHDISKATNIAVVGHLRSHTGAAGNWLNAQALRETIKLTLLHQYKMGVVHDELINRPASPFSPQKTHPHLWVNGHLVDAKTNQAKRMNGQPIQLVIDMAIHNNNQLIITTHSASLNQPVSLTVSLEEISLTELRKVRNYIATTAGQAGLMKHALTPDAMSSSITEWQPSGLLSVYSRLDELAPGVEQFSPEYLQEAARAWNWLSILSSRISPILAHQHAATAIAHVLLAADSTGLTADQKALIGSAQASAYRDLFALNLLPNTTRYPEINVLRTFSTSDYLAPEEKGDVKNYELFLHALQLMEFTPHRDQAMQSMIDTRHAEDGLFLDSVLTVSSFNKTSITMQLNRGDSGSVTSYAFLLLLNNAQLDADLSSISRYLDAGNGFSYAAEMMYLMEQQATAAPILLADNRRQQRQYQLLKEVTHRLISASNYKLSMWRAWGMRDNMVSRLNEGLAALLEVPSATPESAHAFITFNRYASRTTGWQGSYKNKIKRTAIDWSAAYPGVPLLNYLEDPFNELAAQWAVSSIDAIRVAAHIKRSDLLFGSPLEASEYSVPEDYLLNYTLSPKWWQSEFTSTPIPQRYADNWKTGHELAKAVAKRDPQRAIALYEAVLSVHQYRLEVPSMELEKLYVDTGQRSKAIEVVKKFIASDPQGFLDVSSAQQRLAEHYIHSGRFEEAYAIAYQASNSGSARGYQTLIISAVLARKFDVAERTITTMQRHYSSASPYLNQFRTLGRAVAQTVNYEDQWQQFINFINQQNISDIAASVWLLPFLREFDLTARFFSEDSEVVRELMARSIVKDWLPQTQIPATQYPWLADLQQIQVLKTSSDDPVTNTSQLLAIDYTKIPAADDVKDAWEEAFKRQMSDALLQKTAAQNDAGLKSLLTELKGHEHWRAWTDVQRPLALINWMIEKEASAAQVNRFIAQYAALNTNCYSCLVLQAIQDIPSWTEKLAVTDIYKTAGQAVYLAVRTNNVAAAENILTALYSYANLDITCGNQTAVATAILATGSITNAKAWMDEQALSARCKADAEFARFEHYEPLANYIRAQTQ
ncbi:tetratricopeptide repeat protein [Alteromonas sp. ASW11-36]|uniref:Tetratricopeptide repeat protein n=1 Tax=Alteromonas arenosi TaxID=3055817 RepID=A0ABT7SY62_9ALTE|nr:tetratricopeptide repeat protein [Alteromonas sp. ASW11-36]MDM7861128.1 tetratricopeptide repeat protein [Alteromonas sp. ASW11-36]